MLRNILFLLVTLCASHHSLVYAGLEDAPVSCDAENEDFHICKLNHPLSSVDENHVKRKLTVFGGQDISDKHSSLLAVGTNEGDFLLNQLWYIDNAKEPIKHTTSEDERNLQHFSSIEDITHYRWKIGHLNSSISKEEFLEHFGLRFSAQDVDKLLKAKQIKIKASYINLQKNQLDPVTTTLSGGDLEAFQSLLKQMQRNVRDI